MKFKVDYAIRKNVYDIILEAADLETCKNAVAQWAASFRREHGLTIGELTILEILPI